MELYFLDGAFNLIKGPVDSFTSAVFSERYYEVGSFVLHLPREMWRELSPAVYVRTGYSEYRGYSGGKCLCGRILYMRSEISGDLEVGGELLEGMLGDRLVLGKGGVSAEGELGAAVLGKVEENLRSLGVAVDRVGSAAIEIPVSGGVGLTWNYDKLSDWLYSVLKPWGASFEVVLDFETNKPVFRLVKGADRSSDGGAAVSGGGAVLDSGGGAASESGSGGVYALGGSSAGAERAVFSSSYGNIFSLSVEKNSAKMKTCAYVEGSDGTVVEVGSGSAGRRVEIYRKASDIRPGDFEKTAGYAAALEQRGEELLAKYPASVYVSAESDSSLVPKYGRDYFLGDVCDVCDGEIGLSCGMRLTGVDTVCEYGGVRVLPYFGETVKLADVIRETIG